VPPRALLVHLGRALALEFSLVLTVPKIDKETLRLLVDLG